MAQSGHKVEGGIEIGFPVTRQNISDMTGTTLHTVSRLLSAWEKSGIVRSTRKHIVVTDSHQLVLLGGLQASLRAFSASRDQLGPKLRLFKPYSAQASLIV